MQRDQIFKFKKSQILNFFKQPPFLISRSKFSSQSASQSMDQLSDSSVHDLLVGICLHYVWLKITHPFVAKFLPLQLTLYILHVLCGVGLKRAL